MVKKITVSLSIILICAAFFINGYTFVYPSYADSTTDNWTTVTTNQELAEAFRYYCKSRNLSIEGSVLDALTTFTTNNFNTICNTLGIDVTALQAHLKRSTDSNGKVQFLFDQFGVTAFNRIFAEFLQNNNLEVGDNVPETNLYNGYEYNGNLFYIFSTSSTSSPFEISESNMIQLGSVYPYSYETIMNCFGSGAPTATTNIYQDITLPDGTYTATYNYQFTSGSNKYLNYISGGTTSGTYGGRYYRYSSNPTLKGWNGLFINNYTGKIYFGIVGHAGTYYYFTSLHQITDENNEVKATEVYITTNNTTINNNNYTDNSQTVINNEGDVYNYDYDDDDPPVNPDGGGSGGGSDGDITFPDFNFDIPDLDWSLGDLSEKFPFSIPFDLLAFFTVLNAEPVAPSIDAYIPLGSWYTWHFQADFSQFNNWATIIRNVEFIAFCIGLIYLTIRLVKG